MEREPHRSVDLPERLVSRVEARLPGTRFESVAAYVSFTLEEVLVHVEEEDVAADEPTDDAIEARLESLGYLE